MQTQNVSTAAVRRPNGATQHAATQKPTKSPPSVATTSLAPTLAVPATGVAGGVPNGATVSLKALLAEYGLPADGKLARRKLRAAKLPAHSHNDRWQFAPGSEYELAVRAVLAGILAPQPKAVARVAVLADL